MTRWDPHNAYYAESRSKRVVRLPVEACARGLDGMARLAEEVRTRLWRDIPADPADAATWRQPVVRLGMYQEPPFVAAASTPRLTAAFDQLAGQGAWRPCGAMGTFPVRFPSPEDPGDVGWHVDVSIGDDPDFVQWRVNARSK